MASPKRQVQIFGRSFERSRTLAASLFGLALAFMIVGTALEGPIGTILAAIGSTLGTTALVSFLYDPFLKDVLAQEIFERVGLRDSIVRAGLLDVRSGSELSLAAKLTGSRRIIAAPLDPLSWAKERFGEIVSVAASAPTTVIVLLPAPDASPARTLLADRLDLVEAELERKLKALPDELLKAWDHEVPPEGTTLRVLWHGALLSSGLLVCDRCAVLEAGPAQRHSATDRMSLAQVFEPSSPHGRWITVQLEELSEAGITAGLRPVTPPTQLPGRHVAAIDAAKSPAGTTQAPETETAPVAEGQAALPPEGAEMTEAERRHVPPVSSREDNEADDVA